MARECLPAEVLNILVRRLKRNAAAARGHEKEEESK